MWCDGGGISNPSGTKSRPDLISSLGIEKLVVVNLGWGDPSDVFGCRFSVPVPLFPALLRGECNKIMHLFLALVGIIIILLNPKLRPQYDSAG